jgi:hypothetical protein
MWVATARSRVDWSDPRIDDVVVAGFMMLFEAVVLYYVVLLAVWVCGLRRRTGRETKTGRILLLGPALAIIGLLVLMQLLDMLARKR